MAKLLQLRRGTTAQHSSFTGAEGEVTVDTDKDTLVVHDNATAGGKPLATEAAVVLKAPLASPALVTPNLGTPSSGVMTNMTGAVEASLVDNAVTLAKMAGGTDGNLITYDTSGDPAYVATGTSGHVLTSGGADAVPTFQGLDLGTSVTAVANGAIANGSKLIMQADGKVAVALGTTILNAVGSSVHPTGSEVAFGGTCVVYHPPTDKFLVMWHGTGGSYGYMAVGTLSGTTVTFGTVVTFASTTILQNTITAEYDPTTEKVLILYADSNSSTQGRSVQIGIHATTFVPSVDGGPSTMVGTDYFTYGGNKPELAYHIAEEKWVIQYREQYNPVGLGTNHLLMAAVGTSNAAGTSMTWTSPIAVNGTNAGAYSQYHSICYDESSEKLLHTYRDTGDSEKGKGKVGSISGTTLTLGTASTFANYAVDQSAMSYDPGSKKIVLSWTDQAADVGKYCNATVTGTAVTFGSESQFSGSLPYYLQQSYDPSNKTHSLFYGLSSGPSNLTLFTVGSSGYIGALTLEINSSTDHAEMDCGGGGGGVLCVVKTPPAQFASTALSAYAVTLAGVSGNVKLNNFIGISDGIYADTATATIQTSGSTDDAQSGLTIGSTYYLQGTGAIATTPDSNFDQPIPIGIALTATTLLLKG